MIRLGAMVQDHVVVVSREDTDQISAKTAANPVDALAFGVKTASLVSDADNFISNVRRSLPSLFLGKKWLHQRFHLGSFVVAPTERNSHVQTAGETTKSAMINARAQDVSPAPKNVSTSHEGRNSLSYVARGAERITSGARIPDLVNFAWKARRNVLLFLGREGGMEPVLKPHV